MLRDDLIRLANENPDLRREIVPLLRKHAKVFSTNEELKKYLHEHPQADRKKHRVKQKGESGQAEDPARKRVPGQEDELPEDAPVEDEDARPEDAPPAEDEEGEVPAVEEEAPEKVPGEEDVPSDKGAPDEAEIPSEEAPADEADSSEEPPPEVDHSDVLPEDESELEDPPDEDRLSEGAPHGDTPESEDNSEGDAAEAEEEEFKHEDKLIPSHLQSLKKLTGRVRDYLAKAPHEVRQFVEDEKQRKEVIKKALSLPKASAIYMARTAWHEVKTKGGQFKEAHGYVKALAMGKKPTKKQKIAMRELAIDVALVTANGFLIHGLVASKIVQHSVSSFTHGIAEEIATRVVSETVDDLSLFTDIGETGFLGYKFVQKYITKYPQAKKWLSEGVHLIRQYIKVGADESAQNLTIEEALQLIILAATADALENLDEDTIVKGLEKAAAEGGEEGVEDVDPEEDAEGLDGDEGEDSEEDEGEDIEDEDSEEDEDAEELDGEADGDAEEAVEDMGEDGDAEEEDDEGHFDFDEAESEEPDAAGEVNPDADEAPDAEESNVKPPEDDEDSDVEDERLKGKKRFKDESDDEEDEDVA